MGYTKDLLIKQMEELANEVVDECEICGGDVTAERLNEMPYDGGIPVFVICEDCWDEGAQDDERRESRV